MWQKFLAGFTNPFANPVSFQVLIIAAALALLIALFLVLRKLKLDTRTLVIASMCVTISFVLSYIRFFTLPQGGSVTPGSMLPVMLFAWCFGPLPGLAVGVVYGVLQFIQDGAVMSYGVLEPLFDYIFAFGILCVVGFFKKRLSLGILAAGALRYAFHVASGVLFFSMYAGPGQAPLAYSLVYNAFMLPEVLICLAIAGIPQFKSAIARAFKQPVIG